MGQTNLWTKLLFSLLICGAAYCAENESRMVEVKNPSFEKWNSGISPCGWIVKGTIAKQDNDSADAKSCLKIQGPFSYMQQNVRFYPQTEYLLECSVKCCHTQGTFVFKVEQNLCSIQIKGKEDISDKWQKLSLRFNSNLEKGGRIIFLLRGTGYCLVDNVRLYQISSLGGKTTLDAKRLQLGAPDYADKIVDFSKFDALWPNSYAAGDKKVVKDDAKMDWHVGQWIRYKVNDKRLIPSRKSREKKPETSLIEYSIVGKEDKCYWVQVTVRLKQFWAIEPSGESEGGPVLVDQPRKLVIKLLVDGPDWKDIRRYIIQIDTNKPLEFRIGKSAALPDNNLLRNVLLLRKNRCSAEAEERIDTLAGAFKCSVEKNKDDTVFMNYALPVTGIVKADLNSPYLNRTVEVLDWGSDGAQDNISGVPELINVQQSPVIGNARMAIDRKMRFSQDYVIAKIETLQSAGIDYFAPYGRQITKDYLKTQPVYFVLGAVWTLDIFDPWRSNLYRSQAHVDEPYERQENFSEVMSLSETKGKSLAEVAGLYVDRVKKMIADSRRWDGDKACIYEGHSYIAWYDLQAGADLFIYEDSGRTPQWQKLFKELGMEELSDEEMLRWQYSFIKGAADYFGKKWGVSVYFYSKSLKLAALKTAYDMGAEYLGLWQENEKRYPLYEIMNLALDIKKYMKENKPAYNQKAEIVFLLPDGFIAARSRSMFGACVKVDEKYYRLIMKKLIKQTIPLVKQKIPYAVAVDNKLFRPEKFSQVIKIK